MKNVFTYKKAFKIYLPGTKDREPQYVRTIEIDCYENFGQDFICPESHKRIEREKLKAIFYTDKMTFAEKTKIFSKYFWGVIRPRYYRAKYFFKNMLTDIQKSL